MPTRLAPSALHKGHMRSFFDRVVKQWYPKGTRLLGLVVSRHGHFAFKQAVSYRLTLATPSGRRAHRVIRGNVPSADTVASVAVGLAVQKRLYQHGFAFGRFRVPLSLGFYPKLQIGLYENFPGTTLAELMSQNNDRALTAAVTTGQWLARLHASRVRIRSVRKPAHIQRELGYFIDNFQRGYPVALGDLRALSGAVQKVLATVLKARPRRTLVHGDFHPANIIVHPNGAIGVIDFGNCSMYDPASDVASFLAQTDRFVWDNKIGRRRADTIKKIFLDAYCRESGLSLARMQKTLDLHYCWWVLQLLSYSVVIRSIFARERLTRHGLQAIREILKKYRAMPSDTPFEKIAFGKILQQRLTSSTEMLDFFSARLATLIPDAQHIQDILIAQPGALSLTSFLTRYTVRYWTIGDRPKTVVLRGNRIPAITYQLLVGLTKNPRLQIMRPLTYLPRPSYLFYHEVPGKRFREISPNQTNYSQYLRAIADTLAQLHQAPAFGQRWAQTDERRFIRSRLAIVQRFDRGHAAASRRLAATLTRSLSGAWPQRSVTTHGDLQGSNLIISADNRAWLIDFTLAKRFHPAHDVATFITHLDIMLLRHVPAGQRRRFRETFLRHYYTRVGSAMSSMVQSALPYHCRRAALDIIAITVTNLGDNDPHRDTYVEHLLRENNLPYFNHV